MGLEVVRLGAKRAVAGREGGGAAGWAAHARWTNSANHVSYIVLLLNIIDFTVVCGRWPAGAGVCRLRPSRAAHRLSSPPIEIYPPKTSPTQEWIIRFILRFRNFHLEGFECGSNDPVEFPIFCKYLRRVCHTETVINNDNA